MQDLRGTPEEFLAPIARVVETMLAHADNLRPDDVMVVGARGGTSDLNPHSCPVPSYPPASRSPTATSPER